MLRSEEEPVFPFRSDGLSFLQIRAKRCDSRPRSHHDDWSVRIFRQMKMFRHTGENRHGHVISAFREERRGYPFADATMTFIADHVHDKMHLIGIRLQARGD